MTVLAAEPQVRVFLSMTELARLFGYAQVGTPARRLRAGRLLTADVAVGRAHGWDRERSVRFGVAMGIIDEQEKPLPRASGGNPYGRDEELFAPWQGVPVEYLSAQQAAQRWGIAPVSMWQRRQLGTFPHPAVQIGSGDKYPAMLYGWSVADVVREGRQYGFIAPGEQHAR